PMLLLALSPKREHATIYSLTRKPCPRSHAHPEIQRPPTFLRSSRESGEGFDNWHDVPRLARHVSEFPCLNPLGCGGRSARVVNRSEQGHELRWKAVDETLAALHNENGLESFRVTRRRLGLLKDGPEVSQLLISKAVELSALSLRKV